MKFTFKATKTTIQGISRLKFDLGVYRKQLDKVEDGTSLLVTVTDQRSLDQNDKFHAVFSSIAKETGESMANIKKYMKHHFLGYEISTVNGEEIKELRSTSSLSIEEGNIFITQMEVWAFENLNMRPYNEDV
jgi:hypothetical protein